MCGLSGTKQASQAAALFGRNLQPACFSVLQAIFVKPDKHGAAGARAGGLFCSPQSIRVIFGVHHKQPIAANTKPAESGGIGYCRRVDPSDPAIFVLA